MDEKYNESTHNRPEGDRMLDAPFVISDLQAHMKQIVSEEAYTNGDRNAITLFKSGGVTVVLIALQSGATINTPEPSGKVAIAQVLSGSIDVEIGSETSTVGNGQLISFHSQTAYNISATEEVMLLLSYYN